MVEKKDIVPGTPEWEDICVNCGLCCLQQYCDNDGGLFLTRIKCNHLTHDNKCWNEKPDEKCSPNGFCHRVSKLDIERLKSDYVVPATCPYVQKFVKKTRVKVPDMSRVSFVPASAQEGSLAENVIAGTHKLFRYNPSVNKMLKFFFEKLK